MDNNNIINKIDYTKHINSRCVSCSKPLTIINNIIVMLDPCEHIMHFECVSKTCLKCPKCGLLINKIYNKDQLLHLSTNNKFYYQKYVDLLSVSNYDYKARLDYPKFIIRSPELMYFIGSLLLKPHNPETAIEYSHKFAELLNLKINITGLENINKENKIYISNHTTFMDFIMMFLIFRCGFVATQEMNKPDSWPGNKLTDYIPLLFVTRGESNNTVEQIKQYVKHIGSLGIFPQGIMTHPDTLSRFRTGAFYADSPVQPIVIKYKNLPHNDIMKYFLVSLLSYEKIEIDIHILKTYYPPFNNNKIEHIRARMAEAGNMALTRTCNRDVTDK